MQTGKIEIKNQRVYVKPDEANQLVEVSNVYWNEELKEWLIQNDYKIIKNNQPCKFEITKEKYVLLLK